MGNTKITFNAPQVVGNLVVVTGRIDNCHLSQQASTGDFTNHDRGVIDVSNYMREVLAFKSVTTQPIDLHVVHRGTNLDTSSDAYTNVSVTGGFGTGMQIGRILIDTRVISGTMDVDTASYVASGSDDADTLLGTGYRMGDIVTAQVPVASGTDRPKFRIMPAGAMARSYIAGGGPDFNHLLLCSAQPSRFVKTAGFTGIPIEEIRNKVYFRGFIPVQELRAEPGTTPSGLNAFNNANPMSNRNSIAGHAKFIIIGRR